uniref:G_PROTEIN_RECEP_F1_2 domain-containing protein n=1 Tax=Panagrellus redivivus TaxID=6233 RepID=A0A7E4VBJ5_PANRE
MREYRRILFQSCMFDIFYAVTSGILQAKVETYNGVIIVIPMGIPNAIRFHIDIFTSIWVVSLYALIFFLPTQFVYRYLVIVRRVVISWKIYVLMMTPTSIVVCLLGVGYYWSMSAAPDCSAEILKAIKQNHDGIDYTCQVILFTHPVMQSCMALALISIACCTIMIPVLNYRVYSTNHKNYDITSGSDMLYKYSTIGIHFDKYGIFDFNIVVINFNHYFIFCLANIESNFDHLCHTVVQT